MILNTTDPLSLIRQDIKNKQSTSKETIKKDTQIIYTNQQNSKETTHYLKYIGLAVAAGVAVTICVIWAIAFLVW